MLSKEAQRISTERKKNAEIIDLGEHDKLRWKAIRDYHPYEKKYFYECQSYCTECKTEGHEAPCFKTKEPRQNGVSEYQCYQPACKKKYRSALPKDVFIAVYD